MKTKFNYIMLIAVGLLFATAFTALAADKKAKKKNNIEIAGITPSGEVWKKEVDKADKDAYLEMSEGGVFTLHDTNNPDLEVCLQARDRLLRWSKKRGWYLTKKSAKEANMSEELYENIRKQMEKNIDYIDYIKKLHNIE